MLQTEDRQVVRLAEAIAQRVGHQRYQVWFHNSTRMDLKHDGLEIAVPNDFISDWIGSHFAKPIQEAANEVLGCSLPLKFNVMPQLFDGSILPAGTTPSNFNGSAPGSANESIMQSNLASGLRADLFPMTGRQKKAAPAEQVQQGEPRRAATLAAATVTPNRRPPVHAATPVETAPAASSSNGFNATNRPRLRHDFDTFIVGPSNQLAHNAALHVSEFPGSQYNPLFIHGNCGLGKTHLLQGLCKRFADIHPTKRWVYITGEEFTNEFVFALRNNKVDAFRRKMRDLDLLVIDDVHFLGGKKATQEEFLHTFNAIEAMGKQVVLASDEHPKMIGEFGESLINRFVSGMVVRMDAPNFSMRCEILRAMTLRTKTYLNEEVIAWVAKRVTQNVRELEGASNRVVAHTRLTGRPADIALAQEALGDLDRALAAPVRPENVLAAVCDHFGLEMKELMSGRRQRTISLARSVSMFLIRKTGKLSFPEIAGRMGKRNHSTVISACRRIERAAAKNERLAWTSNIGERDEEANELLQRLEEQARVVA